MEALKPILALGLCIGGVYIIVALVKRRRKIISQMVFRWAQENNVKVLAHKTLFSRGPFLFKGAPQFVCKIMVEDESGNTKTAWLRLGGVFSGLMRYHVECKWDRL